MASNFPTAYVRVASQTYVLQHMTCETESAAKLVTLLLDNGANPNLADRDNIPPLLIAAFEGIT